jgi:hypothetical protein
VDSTLLSATPGSKKIKLALLAYAWNPNGTLDAYISSFLETFLNLGIDVDVFLANRITQDLGIYGVGKNYDIKKFGDLAHSRKYDLALSFNNALLYSELKSQVSFPIITWIVDDFPHIFQHEGTEKIYEPFQACSTIIVSSTDTESRARKILPELGERIRFIPTATQVATDLLTRPHFEKKHNITLVASYLETAPATHLIRDSIEKEGLYDAILTCLERLEIDYKTDFDSLTKTLGLEAFLKEKNWPPTLLKNHLTNLLSNRERVEISARLQKLGLHVFGNSAWIEALSLRPEIGRVFQAGTKVSKHQELMDLYNSSKICINIPQIQGGPALPYRVMDILASDSLLITKYHPQSDAYHLFGPDCPIVTYKSQEELENLCAYYMAHDEERQKRVRSCNQLVAKGFSFRERALDLIALHLPELALKLGTEKLTKGKSRFQNMDVLLTFAGRIRTVRLNLIKAAIRAFILITLPNKIKRRKLASLILEA